MTGEREVAGRRNVFSTALLSQSMGSALGEIALPETPGRDGSGVHGPVIFNRRKSRVGGAGSGSRKLTWVESAESAWAVIHGWLKPSGRDQRVVQGPARSVAVSSETVASDKKRRTLKLPLRWLFLTLAEIAAGEPLVGDEANAYSIRLVWPSWSGSAVERASSGSAKDCLSAHNG